MDLNAVEEAWRRLELPLQETREAPSTYYEHGYRYGYQQYGYEHGYNEEEMQAGHTRVSHDYLGYPYNVTAGSYDGMAKRPAHDIKGDTRPTKRRKQAPPLPIIINNNNNNNNGGGGGGYTDGGYSASCFVSSPVDDDDELCVNKPRTNEFPARLRPTSCDQRFDKRWESYARTRWETLKKDRASETSDAVARAHDQKVSGLWAQHKNTLRQLQANVRAAAKTHEGSVSCTGPSVPQKGWCEIQEARMDFLAASRGLRSAERRERTARDAEQSFLDAAKALIAARRESEENLRLALAQAHPYWDLVRRRLERDLRQSIADTSEIALLSTTRLLALASSTALKNASVDLLSRQKMVARLNRERVICRVHRSGGKPIARHRLREVQRPKKLSVPLPQRTIALVTPRASVPDSTVSPRLHVVFSQLRAIDTAMNERIADKKRQEQA